MNLEVQPDQEQSVYQTGCETVSVRQTLQDTFSLDWPVRKGDPGDRPRGSKGIPARKVLLVLHQLTKPPFKPLKNASLKYLTF